MVTWEQALQVKTKYEDYYLRVDGITGISVVNNEIVIYVRHLTPALRSFLPITLEGVPVRIEEQIFLPMG